MQNAENIINTFTTRVRQLILLVRELKNEKTELQKQIKLRDSKINELNTQISQMEKDYKNLTMAKMLTLTDGDLDDTKRRITRLISSVDKCITLVGNTQK